MKYTEQTALFACAGDTLLGIMAKPEMPANTGVIVIAGGPQYRVGSHRQFVLLSRTLATAGYPVLRFDYRGMGDSEGPQRDFQTVSADIAAAIGVMQKNIPSVKDVTLWGLCDGASAALLYCFETHDPRVSGLCLLNPWVRSEASLAKTQVKHYYMQRLRQEQFWIKLLRGKVAANAITDLMRSLKAALSGEKSRASKGDSQTFQQRMAMAWGKFNGHILLVLSDDDYVAKEFLEYVNADTAWSATFTHPSLSRHDLPAADHTFSNLASRIRVEELTIDWLETLAMRAGVKVVH